MRPLRCQKDTLTGIILQLRLAGWLPKRFFLRRVHVSCWIVSPENVNLPPSGHPWMLFRYAMPWRTLVCCLLALFFAESALAQQDGLLQLNDPLH